MENSIETSFKKTISSTLSLITVLFEDLFEAITLHREFNGEKVRFKPSTSLLNKTDTCDGHDFNIDVLTDEANALQKELLVLLEGFVSLVICATATISQVQNKNLNLKKYVPY